MRPDFAARVAISALCLASCAALAAACDASTSSASMPPLASAGAGSSLLDAGADAADAEVAPDSLAFDPSDTLTLAPKATQTLKVVTTPPGSFRVRFALLGAGSDGDAALDANEVDTDDQGVARVTLTAPSTPTTFSVRASVAKVQTLLGVSVSALDYTTLRVLPSYSGKRSITIWTATASAGVSCANLVGDPPPDGDLSTTAAVGQPLDLQKVPVGVDLAVTLRAGHYIGGCANQSALTEADDNQVLVYASDRPVNFDGSALDLSFGITSPSSALVKQLNGSKTEAESALGSGASDDVAALLDAMQSTTASASRDSFAAARLAYGWDAAVSTAFGSNAASRLRDPADRWLSAGLTRFFSADAFSAQLGPSKLGATLTLNSVAQIPAADAGFASTFPATWSADSSDTVLLGTALSWNPSRLLTALALLPATTEDPKAVTVEAALADSVDCTLVASTLVARSSAPGTTAYASCDQACVQSACVNAIALLWKQAATAASDSSASLSVSGTGAAEVGDDASITSLTGSWVGQLQLDTDTEAASGPIDAKASGN